MGHSIHNAANCRQYLFPHILSFNRIAEGFIGPAAPAFVSLVAEACRLGWPSTFWALLYARYRPPTRASSSSPPDYLEKNSAEQLTSPGQRTYHILLSDLGLYLSCAVLSRTDLRWQNTTPSSIIWQSKSTTHNNIGFNFHFMHCNLYFTIGIVFLHSVTDPSQRFYTSTHLMSHFSC